MSTGPEDETRVRRDEDGEVRREGVVRETRTEAVAGDPRRDVGIVEARRRFGGVDVPASLVGMLTALAMTVLLAGIIGAALGAVGYQTGLEEAADEEELGIAGFIGGLIVLFLAYLIGGWAAARIARYDGVRNGVMTVVWTIVLAAILSALAAWLGEEYDVFELNELPQFFRDETLAAGAIISAVAALAAMLLGGALGGAWGERYHRRADATIAGARAVSRTDVER